jgi:hypothetical protein
MLGRSKTLEEGAIELLEIELKLLAEATANGAKSEVKNETTGNNVENNDAHHCTAW